MIYDWEKKITPALLRRIEALLPRGFVLRGIAVERTATVEGALIEHMPGFGDVMVLADVWKDINGDAARHYEGYVKALFPDTRPGKKGGDA